MVKTFIFTIIITVLATIPVFHHISIPVESDIPTKEVALNGDVHKESKGNVHQTIEEDGHTRKTDIHVFFLLFIAFVCFYAHIITESWMILRLPLYIVLFPVIPYVITWLLGIKYNIDIFILMGTFIFIVHHGKLLFHNSKI